MNIRTILSAAAALALTATLAACGQGSGSSADGTTKLTVGTVGIGSDAAIAMAQDQGFFADEGLEVEISVVANPPAGVAAAQSGQLDITYTPSIPLLTALSQGVDLKVLGAADGYPDGASDDPDPSVHDDTGLFVQESSKIETPKDLEGKKIAVPARKAQIEVTVANMVLADGGDPSSIQWMVLDPASSLQSLQQGRVDAAGLVAPFTTNADESGMRLLGSPGVSFFEEGAIGLWVAAQSTIDKQPEAIDGFIRAMGKANAYANDHLDEADEKAAEITGVSLETVKQGAEGYWPAAVKIEEIQRVNQRLVQLGYLEEEVKIDGELIHQAK